MGLLRRTLLLATAALSLVACSGAAQHDANVWQEFSPELVSELAVSGKPVFVEFSADWCGTCRANKPKIADPAVMAKFEELDVQLVMADWTDRDPSIKSVLQMFGRRGVPLYLLYDGHGGEPTVLPKVLSVDGLLESLSSLN